MGPAAAANHWLNTYRSWSGDASTGSIRRGSSAVGSAARATATRSPG